MKIHLKELSVAQVMLLGLLDDAPQEDSVGVETGDLSDAQLAQCLELHTLGLVSADIGWRDTCWFRLTPRGRRVHRVGAA